MASVADAFADDLEQIRQVRASSLQHSEFAFLTVAHAGVKGAEYDKIAFGYTD
jgi:hypothetical protein